MTYDYTKEFLKNEYHYHTVSSGIRPTNEKGKWAGPVFVRVKANSGGREKLEETMIVLCDLLNRGALNSGAFFTTKSNKMNYVREYLILCGYCKLEEGKLKCLK